MYSMTTYTLTIKRGKSSMSLSGDCLTLFKFGYGLSDHKGTKAELRNHAYDEQPTFKGSLMDALCILEAHGQNDAMNQL